MYDVLLTVELNIGHTNKNTRKCVTYFLFNTFNEILKYLDFDI